jgi:hypothetical protein
MTNPEQHPITPSPELLNQWTKEWVYKTHNPATLNLDIYIATQAARWGADQELEACREWFEEFYKTESWSKRDLEHFRAARRPKPPSLKERALAALGPIERTADAPVTTNRESLLLIRQALEALPND